MNREDCSGQQSLHHHKKNERAVWLVKGVKGLGGKAEPWTSCRNCVQIMLSASMWCFYRHVFCSVNLVKLAY